MKQEIVFFLAKNEHASSLPSSPAGYHAGLDLTFSLIAKARRPYPNNIMKTKAILIQCMTPALLLAQEPAAERNPWKASSPAIPEAVSKARIHAQTVLPGASGTAGGNLILQRIDPPDASSVRLITPVPEPAKAAGNFSAGELAARRASEPNELQFFSPTVVVLDNGVSMVRWGAVDPLSGYRQYAAWVRLDLSTIHACGDLTVGRRRYCLLPVMFHATDRMNQKWKAPAPLEFKRSTDIILAEGDPDNKAALEPLLALLGRYDTAGDQIAATAAAIKADQEARDAWEEAHPQKPEDVVIKFWPIQSTQYPTKVAK